MGDRPETEVIGFTLRDSGGKALWSARIDYAVKMDQWGLLDLRFFPNAVLPYAGRDLIPTLTRTEAIEITLAGEPPILVDDVELERIVQHWRRISSTLHQYDWSDTPRPQPM